MLKEVEEMKNSDMSHLEVSQVVSAVEIEKLLDHKDTTTTNNKKLNDIDDNLYDTNPQVIIEDMKGEFYHVLWILKRNSKINKGIVNWMVEWYKLIYIFSWDKILLVVQPLLHLDLSQWSL